MARPYDVKTDVEISIFTYPVNQMVWNIGRWDENNWSTSSQVESWVNISGDVVSVETTNGVSIERGYARPVSPTASIVYTGSEYDPFQNTMIRPGTPVRVRVLINPDTFFATWITIWQGVITNTSVSYHPNTWLNLVTLECEQPLREVLNYISSTGVAVATPCYAYDFINEINTLAGTSITASTVSTLRGYQLDGLTTTQPVNFGNLLNLLTDTNLGALIYRPIRADSTTISYYTWADILANSTSVQVAFEAEPSAVINRSDFSDILIGFDTSKYVNTLRYYTAGGVDDVVQNADNAAIAGNLEGEVTTRHYYAADADAAAAQVVALIPTRAVQQITAPVIRRDTGSINNYLLLDPFEKASVSIDNSKIVVDETYYVTNVSYRITPDSWDATFDLWIGR